MLPNNAILVERTASAQWKTFYRVAAIASLLIVLAGLVDSFTSMAAGEAAENSSISIGAWFTMFTARPFYAFSGLGIFNILTLSLGIPIYVAFHNLFHPRYPVAALAGVLFLIGVAVYMSSNAVFPLYALSRQYVTAAAGQQPLIEAAGRAALAAGADLTPGTFLGFFFTQTAGLLITSLMLRGHIFRKFTALTGLLGFVLTSIFFVLAAFSPRHFALAMSFAMPGGLVLIVYQILLARRFFQLAR